MEVGGQILWNVTPICETSQIYYLMGRLHTKDVLENLSTDQSFRLVHWLSITLTLRRTSQESIILERKSCLDCSLDTLSTGGIWKGDVLVADIEELEQMDVFEIHARRLNAKGVSTPMSGEKFISPIADGTVKLSGGDQVLRTSILIWESPDRGEEQGTSSRRIRTVFINPIWRLIVALRWSKQWFLVHFRELYHIHRHHVEPRVKLYVPREESFPIPLKFFDATRTTDTSLYGMQEKSIDDYWNVDGDRELSDVWTEFTRFTTLDDKPLDGYTLSRSRLTREQTTSRLFVARNLEICRMRGSEEKSKSGLPKKPKLDNARKLRGIYFIDPSDEEFKEIMREENWKFRCQPRCLANPDARIPTLFFIHSSSALAKIWVAIFCHKWEQQSLAQFNVRRTGKPVASLKPTNIRRSAWKELFTKVMKIILQGVELIHWTTTILCAHLFLCLKQWKNQMQKQQWRKNG